MRIEQLGDLSPDPDIPEWLVSRPVAVPYFDGTKIKFVIDSVEDDDRPDEFAAAVRRFLALSTSDRDVATAHVFSNYRALCDAIGEEEVGVTISEPPAVWSRVRPTEIHVARRSRGDRKVYVKICAECTWEPEHGLQIVYREGSDLSRVSGQDRHLTHADAYGLPESQDRIA